MANGQSRAMSLVESIANVAVGVATQMLGNVVLFPLFGFYPSFSELLSISAIMTAISIARSFTLRRLFERARELP